MKWYKQILLLFLLMAANVFGAASVTEVTSNIVASVVYPSTNWPATRGGPTFNFSRLPNLNNAQTWVLLKRVGFTLSSDTAFHLQVASNSICITNIPGISGSCIFFNGDNFTGGNGLTNAPALYMSISNFQTFAIGGPYVVPNRFIDGCEVGMVWVTNNATQPDVGSYDRLLNTSASTNNTMSIGDVFNLSGYVIHHNFFASSQQLLISTNGLSGEYTEENYLGRMWLDESRLGFAGGGMTLAAAGGMFPQATAPWQGVYWKVGWQFCGPTGMRVWSGPNRQIRTLQAMSRWNPFRSAWIESVFNNAGLTNRCLQACIQTITFNPDQSFVLPPSYYLETNNAAPYGAGSFRGNVVTANSGSFDALSVTNPPTQSSNVVNLAALQNSLRTNGAVGSVTQTNFNLLQTYTNSSGLVQAYSGSIGLTPAAVVGSAGIMAFWSRDNGATFSPVARVTEGTAIGLTSAPATNAFVFFLNTNDQCYFTNISAGIGNAAALIAGSGQVTLMGASTATTITATNAITAQYQIGDTNSRPYVETNYAQGGAALAVMIHTNATLSSSFFTISVSGTGTAAANTNQFRINFGKNYANPPQVYMTMANSQTQTLNQATTTWLVSYNSITTSNFNVISGLAVVMSATLSNVYQFFVGGSQ